MTDNRIIWLNVLNVDDEWRVYREMLARITARGVTVGCGPEPAWTESHMEPSDPDVLTEMVASYKRSMAPAEDG